MAPENSKLSNTRHHKTLKIETWIILIPDGIGDCKWSSARQRGCVKLVSWRINSINNATSYLLSQAIRKTNIQEGHIQENNVTGNNVISHQFCKTSLCEPDIGRNFRCNFVISRTLVAIFIVLHGFNGCIRSIITTMTVSKKSDTTFQGDFMDSQEAEQGKKITHGPKKSLD